MKRVSLIFPFALLACGGGGGGGGSSNPDPDPTPFTPPAPVPSSFYTDNSNNLPASRITDCFDSKAVDIDDDGDLDLILAIISGPNLIYVNDGNGNFSDESSTRIPQVQNGISEHVTTGDLNNDGSIDIVIANVVNNNGAANEYYLNDGNGVFSAAPNALTNDGLSSFVSANDFDGDGDLDLFFANFGRKNLLINDSNGVFSDESSNRLPVDTGLTEDSIITDLNNDGALDILLSLRGTNTGEGEQNLVWINDGNGNFSDDTAARLPQLENSTFDAQLGDVNGDGFDDLVIGNASVVSNGNPLLDNLLINDGNGVFTDVTANQWPQATLSNTFGIRLIDLDRDGDLDILTAEWAYNGANNLGQFRAYSNDGNGNFQDQTNTLIGNIQGNGINVTAADFNNDSLTDLYFCNAGQDAQGAAQGATDFLLLGQ